MPPLVLPSVSLVSRRLLFVFSSRLSTSVGGERGGSLFACLPSFLRRAGGGRCRLDGVGGTDLLLGVSASGGGCVGFVVSLFVYINWVFARVLLLLSKESD